MTDTPETDELKEDIWATPYVDGQDFSLMVDHARKLERERDRLAEALEYILGIGLTEKTKSKAEKALQQLTKKL